MVGFSVSTSGELQVSQGGRIPYEIIQTNAGGRYDSQLHEFVCPDTGFYLFTISQFSSSPGSDIALFRDGHAVGGNRYY